MKFVSLSMVVCVIVWGLSITGCGGGSAEVKAQTYTKTLGRELMDLHDSYKRGIITEKDYTEVKKKVLEQRTR
jgi:hypothetical protein